MPWPHLDITPDNSTTLGARDIAMGECIVSLLELLGPACPDAESSAHVLMLARFPARWSAAHQTFQEIRRRHTQHEHGPIRRAQYLFEEWCCKAMFNATKPLAPFDLNSAFFIVPSALTLATLAGVPTDHIIAACAPPSHPSA